MEGFKIWEKQEMMVVPKGRRGIMRKNATRILFGLVLVGAAVLLFGNSIGWWDAKNFSGWWTVFLIVPGIAGIISYGFSIWNSCLVLVGVWFLACKQSSRI